MNMNDGLSNLRYDEFLHNLKERIRNSQVRAALAINLELVLLYWQIGCEIVKRQQEQGWGEGDRKAGKGSEARVSRYFGLLSL